MVTTGPVVSPYMVPVVYPMYPLMYPRMSPLTSVYHAPDDIITEDGLKVEVVSTSANCPRYVAEGDILTVHYTGYFLNGEIFESSRTSPEEEDPELPEEELNWNFDDGNSGFNPGTGNDIEDTREGRNTGKGRGKRDSDGEPFQFVIGKKFTQLFTTNFYKIF